MEKRRLQARARQPAREFTMTTLEKICYQSSILVCVAWKISWSLESKYENDANFLRCAVDCCFPSAGRRQIFSRKMKMNIFLLLWFECNVKWTGVETNFCQEGKLHLLFEACSCMRRENSWRVKIWKLQQHSDTYSESTRKLEMKYSTSVFHRWAGKTAIRSWNFHLAAVNEMKNEREKIWRVKNLMKINARIDLEGGKFSRVMNEKNCLEIILKRIMNIFSPHLKHYDVIINH
jgi:hypothetical protein